MSNFTEKQLKEIESSAISSDLAQIHIFPVDGEQAGDLLFHALPLEERRNDGRVRDKWLSKYAPILKHGGLAFHGYDLDGDERTECISFKPNQPLSPDRKYEQPPYSKNQAFYPKVTDRVWRLVSDRFGVPMPESHLTVFWVWVRENNIPVIITEGCKKALAAMSLGFPAVGLTGIWNGFITNRNDNGATEGRELIPSLQYLTESKIYIAFDRDKAASTIKNVIQSRSILAKELIEIGCECYSLRWDSDEAKGLDDLIVSGGAAALEKSIAGAEKLNGEIPDFKKPTAASILAGRIAKEWKERVHYYLPTKLWRVYKGGIWKSLDNEAMETVIYHRVLEDVPCLNSANYVATIIKFVRASLMVEK